MEEIISLLGRVFAGDDKKVLGIDRGDEEGEATGCHKQGEFQKLDSGCLAFL